MPTLLTGKCNTKSGGGGGGGCCCVPSFERRRILLSSVAVIAGTFSNNSKPGIAVAAEFADSNFFPSLFSLPNCCEL